MQSLAVKNLFREDVGSTLAFDIQEDGNTFAFPEEIEVGDITGKATVMRLDETVVVSAKLKSNIVFICDRCLDNFEKQIQFSFEREYALDRKGESEDGLYVDKYGDIDLSEPIHDELLLAVPTQNFCKTDCPGICPKCGHNLNHEKCTCKIDE